MAATIEQFRAIGSSFDDALAISILMASIDVLKLASVTASIKTLMEDSLKWEDVCNRLIDEVRTLTATDQSTVRAVVATEFLKRVCATCHETSHATERCFLNPLNENCKLNVNKKAISSILNAKPIGNDKRTARNTVPGWRVVTVIQGAAPAG